MHYANYAIEQPMINAGQGFDYSMCNGSPIRTLFQRSNCVEFHFLTQQGLQDL